MGGSSVPMVVFLWANDTSEAPTVSLGRRGGKADPVRRRCRSCRSSAIRVPGAFGRVMVTVEGLREGTLQRFGGAVKGAVKGPIRLI